MGQEKLLETAIKKYIWSIGGYVQKVHCGAIAIQEGGYTRYMRLADEGTPDLSCIIKGKPVWIEVKKDEHEVIKWFLYPYGLSGKKLKYDKHIEAQKNQRELVKKAGGIHIVVGSLGELCKDLKKLELI